MHRLAPLATLLAFTLSALPAAAQGPAVPTLTVGSASAAGAFELEGTVQAVQQATLAAQVSGNVTALLVKAGERVRAGQPVARIDERDLQAGLARGEAAAAQAEAELRNARVATQRTRELRAQNFVSQAALDTAETQLKAAEAAARQAEAGRSQAALARSFAGVAAPFDAVVLATHVEAGDLAAPGRPLATLYVPGRMRATVQLPASRSLAARVARTVEVQLPDGRWVEPATRNELPGADAVSQTVEWRFEMPAAVAATLAPGVAVRVRFTGTEAGSTAGPARLTVPSTAVLRRGELTGVYAVQGSQFVLKPVRLGARLGDAVEVLAGLKAGERIALDPVRAGLAGATAQ